MTERFEQLNIEIRPNTPEEFRAFVKRADGAVEQGGEGRQHQAWLNFVADEPPRIAGPRRAAEKAAQSRRRRARGTRMRISSGRPAQFPYAPGRGYTPPDAPVENYVALLDHLGFAHGVVVQGNAHGFDNRVLLDALARYPQRLRGVAITDTRIAPATLRDWHALGMRGLRFHLFSDAGRPGYVRGVGLDVFEAFRADDARARLGHAGVLRLAADGRTCAPRCAKSHARCR